MTELSRRSVLAAGTAFALCPPPAVAQGTVRTALPIPRELAPDANGEIVFAARVGEMEFSPGCRTPTYGYNGAYLGPALRLRRGRTVTVGFTNGLPEATTVHWHGLIIPGDADGGPHNPVPAGGHWRPKLSVDQPAATLWFHPHFYPTTTTQVTRGLAGLVIVDDEESDQLGLPSRWGVDDVPLIIQDRRFREDGRFFDVMNLTAITFGYVGNVPLVNGVRYPEAKTARGWVRLRLLDGSNARSYVLRASDDRALFVIASDGGLLETPVGMKQITLHAGERFEVLVDCRSGTPFDLVALPVGAPVMRLPPFDRPLPLVTIRPDGAAGTGSLPDALVKLPPIPAALPAVSQKLVMNMFRDREGMKAMMEAGLGMSMGAPHTMAMAGGKSMGAGMGGRLDPAVVGRATKLIEDQPRLSPAEQLSANGVNGKPFALTAPPDFTARRATDLRWRISEGDDRMPHPVHIHGCQFRIVSQNGQKPEPYRAGWKDIAPVSDGGFSEILLRFPHAAAAEAPYMAHCHILEHEDSGMMAQFTVA
jgi:blue copper oxidase